jgi:hypothetical protein
MQTAFPRPTLSEMMQEAVPPTPTARSFASEAGSGSGGGGKSGSVCWTQPALRGQPRDADQPAATATGT